MHYGDLLPGLIDARSSYPAFVSHGIEPIYPVVECRRLGL
jgi:hypothetical protein